ncbi:MAG: pyridine nucleotide-disulfide oxidoreductase [delta proteobacterium ML8_F1]|nr:MAG: pyridine nucleotide-disulfide oxidoreductase [delta proteobacterium ML8_F1]
MPREKKVEQYDVVIIGGGAAGLTAGIYCGRARLNTLLIEKALVGGLATYTNEIENYPGFPEGTTGLGLMKLFQEQAKKFDVKFKGTDVQKVHLDGEIKKVETFRNIFEAKVVIIAAGGRPRTTGAENEDIFLYDKGISFCATCDAAANTDKVVVVIGSGDAAIEEGTFLTKFASKVIVSVLHDEGIMDCNEIAKEAALRNPKMEFVWNSVVERFEGEDHLERVVLKNIKTDELIPIEADTCFEFIGYLPNTDIFKGIVDMTDRGYINVTRNMETNIQGVFACGDVTEKYLKQVATAVGDGAIAGFATEKYIAESEIFEEQILTEELSLSYIYNAIDGDSRAYLTTMEKLEDEVEAKINIVDVYKSTGIADRLGVKEYPCVVVVKDKKVVEVIKGLPSKEDIQSKL